MTYDTTNLRLSVLERLRTCTGRDLRLNRDIAIVTGAGRRCTDALRHNDNYVMPPHRDDFVVPSAYTSSIDVALALAPVDKRDGLLAAAMFDVRYDGSVVQRLPALIVRAYLTGADLT
jgi:hypothetical protein